MTGRTDFCVDNQKTTRWEIRLTSNDITRGPCSGDSGAPIVNPDNELAAAYTGRQLRSDQSTKECTDVVWTAVSVSPDATRDWVDEMIAKYPPFHGEL